MREVMGVSFWIFGIHLLENVCVLFTLITLFFQTVKIKVDIFCDNSKINWQGITLFTLLATVSMLLPIIDSREGVLFDLRLAVIILGGAYLSVRDNTIVAAAVLAIRIAIGGQGWIWWAIPAFFYGPIARACLSLHPDRRIGLIMASVVSILIYLLTLTGLSRYAGLYASFSPFLSWETFKILAISKVVCHSIAVLVLDKALAKVIAMQQKIDDLVVEATTDDMTGLTNRRGFRQILDDMADRAARSPVSVLMIDVDHFKEYNDTFGHQAGDVVLRRVATAIRACLREHDIVSRYGGEEFIAVLPGVCGKAAHQRAEAMRDAVAKISFPGRSVTISIGVATCQGPMVNKEDIIGKADTALYLAKNLGRNCVCIDTAEKAG